jgi:ribose transport system permease protein
VIRRSLREGAVPPAIVAAVIFALGAILFPRSLTVFDLNSVVSSATPVVLLALGMTFVLLAGEIDLSVGSTMSLTSILLSTWMGGASGRVAPTILLSLAVCLGVGLANGLLTVLVRIPSFIVTLSTLFVIAGVNLLWTNGSPPNNLAPTFATLAIEAKWLLSAGLVVIVAATLLATGVLARTGFGRSLYLIGANRRAAFNTGVPIRTATVSAFVVSSLCAGLAGVYATSYAGSGQTSLGTGMELTAIAAAVIGGVSLFGGKGTAAGACMGALILSLLFNLLLLAGASSDVQAVVTGIVLLLGSLVYNRSARSANWVNALATMGKSVGARLVANRRSSHRTRRVTEIQEVTRTSKVSSVRGAAPSVDPESSRDRSQVANRMSR